ncbi:hypothetical protein ACJONP_05395, partial [Mycoplasmopsis synoviae]
WCLSKPVTSLCNSSFKAVLSIDSSTITLAAVLVYVFWKSISGLSTAIAASIPVFGHSTSLWVVAKVPSASRFASFESSVRKSAVSVYFSFKVV